VNRQHCGDITQKRIKIIDSAQHHRDHRRLPIVNMKDIGHAQYLRGFDDCTAKQAEALRIIGIVTGRCTVESFAVKEFGAIDEVSLNSFDSSSIADTDEAAVRRERDCDAGHNSSRIRQDFGNLPVIRHKHAYSMAKFRQRFWERAHHICHPTRLSPRGTLRRRKNNMHTFVLYLSNQTVSL
jgi:hypothetical protein